MSTLVATKLNKQFKGRHVVKSISLNVSSGEIVGLLGPNGAGKTTSFYMIVGLVQANSGDVHLNGQDISKLPMHARARLGLGYLPQEASIFRKLSVEDNILAILELRSDLSEAERQTTLNALLKEFNIAHLRGNLGISLSGGERRRVEIARALAMDPDFILLDEPFAGVDPISVGDIKAIIKQLQQRNIGVLITDHNVRETLDICGRAYIVSEGEVIAEGSPHEIMQHKQVKAVYLGEDFNL